MFIDESLPANRGVLEFIYIYIFGEVAYFVCIPGEDEFNAPPRDMLDADQHSRAVANERLYHFKCLSSQLGSHLL